MSYPTLNLMTIQRCRLCPQGAPQLTGVYVCVCWGCVYVCAHAVPPEPGVEMLTTTATIKISHFGSTFSTLGEECKHLSASGGLFHVTLTQTT